MLYSPRIPTPPPISDIRKVKKVMKKLEGKELFPKAVERAKGLKSRFHRGAEASSSPGAHTMCG